jgi:hypothetical protein
VHAVHFEATGPVKSFNGMSGGPLFYTRGGAEPWQFAGILVRGSTEARVVRLIDGRAIVGVLDRFYAHGATF